MILHMGSKTAIAILEWMHGRSFSRSDLESHLDRIGFDDPYAKASLQSPIERIMQSIKRNGYASYAGGAWRSDDKIIERAIAFHREAPIEEADVTLRRLTDRAKAIFGDIVTQDAIEDAIAQHGNNRRAGRAGGEARSIFTATDKAQRILDETARIQAETAAIVEDTERMRSEIEETERDIARMNAEREAIEEETRRIQSETIEILSKMKADGRTIH